VEITWAATIRIDPHHRARGNVAGQGPPRRRWGGPSPLPIARNVDLCKTDRSISQDAWRCLRGTGPREKADRRVCSRHFPNRLLRFRRGISFTGRARIPRRGTHAPAAVAQLWPNDSRFQLHVLCLVNAALPSIHRSDRCAGPWPSRVDPITRYSTIVPADWEECIIARPCGGRAPTPPRGDPRRPAAARLWRRPPRTAAAAAPPPPPARPRRRGRRAVAGHACAAAVGSAAAPAAAAGGSHSGKAP